jgi:hypothetical protein
MKAINLLLACLFMTAISYAQPSFQWVKTISGPGGFDQGQSITTDANDNVYATGNFEGVADFDPGPGTYTLTSNNVNFTDIFITRLDAAGNLLWAKSLGTPNADDAGAGIATDAAGNVYVTGNFSGTVDFDPGPSTYTLAAIATDIFVLKLDGAGNFVWAKNMGGTTGSEYGYALALDASSNVYTTGFYNTTVDFDPGPATYTLSSKGGPDVFVSKLDANGNFIWAKSIGGTDIDVAYGIALDGSNNVYTTGNFKGSCDFDPSAASYTLASGGTDDVFVSKLDVNGNFVWAKVMVGNATGNCGGRCIKTDPSGNVYTSGYYIGIVDFDPAATTYTLNSGGYLNGFVSKLSPSGNLSWVGELRGGSTPVMSIAVDAGGNVYGTGSFGESVDFDPAVSSYSLSTTMNSEDVYLFKWSSAGAFVWAQDIASATLTGCTNRSSGVTINPASGTIYTTGYYNYTADFDPGPGTTSLSSVGTSWDAFIHKTGQSGFCTAPVAPINTTPAASQVLCAGNTTTLTASATGTISWYATPTSTTALATGTAYATSALAAGNYTYYAEATTCTVSATRTAMTVTVNASPVIAVNSGSICSGNSFTLTPSGASTYTISGGSAIVSPTTSTSYTVTGTSAAGCTSQVQAISSITVNALPSVSVNSGSICSGSSFTIVPTGASTYTISGGSAIVSPTTSTSYTVTGTSAAGCVGQGQAISTITVNALPLVSVNSGSICSGSSFTIVPTGASTYTISGGSAIVSPTTTSSYTVTGSTAGCVGQGQAISTITVNALPSVSVNSGSICAGSSFTIIPTGASTYTISGGSAIVSPATTTSYTVTGTSAAGCTSQGQAVSTITINALPSLTVIGTPTLICIGEAAKLTVSGANTYTWSTGANTTSISVSPTLTTTYSVTSRSNASGCSHVVSITQSVSACTSLMELEESAFEAYPNPNQGSFSIRFGKVPEDVQIEIADASGRIVYSQEEKAPGEVLQVNLRDYAKGLYFLKISYEGRQQVKKLIIE